MPNNSCITGIVLGAIAGALIGLVLASIKFGIVAMLVLIFLGYHLGAVLDALDKLNGRRYK